MTNAAGNSHGSVAGDFAAYERLPARVRKAIRDAPINIGCAAMLHFMRRQNLDVDELLEEIEIFQIKMLADIVEYAWGKDHPQFKPYIRQKQPWERDDD